MVFSYTVHACMHQSGCCSFVPKCDIGYSSLVVYLNKNSELKTFIVQVYVSVPSHNEQIVIYLQCQCNVAESDET